MKDLMRTADDIPVTLVVGLAYGTLAIVTNMVGPEPEFLQRLVAFGMMAPQQVAAGEPWRLLAHAFLHGNVLHLLLNMASLFSLGPGLERSLGSVRFAWLYALSALGGALAVCAVYPPYHPVVGGSGALFGMMGAAVAMNMRAGRHVFAFLDYEGPRRLLGWIVLNLVMGFAIPIVSNTAHIGGLIAGFLVTFLWLRPGEPSRPRTRWRIATAALFGGLLFWSLVPVTRYDWLYLQVMTNRDAARQDALLRAYLRATPGTTASIEPPSQDPPRRR